MVERCVDVAEGVMAYLGQVGQQLISIHYYCSRHKSAAVLGWVQRRQAVRRRAVPTNCNAWYGASGRDGASPGNPLPGCVYRIRYSA